MLKLLIKGGEKLEKWADQKSKEMQKAMSLALSKEGYRAFKEISFQLKTGKLSLEPKSAYRNEPGDKRYKRRRSKLASAPLGSLFRGITYSVDRKNLMFEFGFRAVTPGTSWQARIAAKSIPGYRMSISEEQRAALHKIGIHLRKTTTAVKVPARDIIGAYLKKNDSIMLENIKNNFRRKMAGERI